MKDKISIPVTISLITLIFSIVIKLYSNLYFEPDSTSLVINSFGISRIQLLIFLTLINILMIFISAFGTNIFLNLSDYINKKSSLHNINRKVKIYLLYFIGYAIFNFLITLYVAINHIVIPTFYINTISIIFFGILSFIIYLMERAFTSKRRNLINVSLIFLLNGAISIVYILR